jgi:cytidylate kinase
MSNRVIAISREFGSGGRTIGKQLADKLGVPCYDAQLIEKIAHESGFSHDFVEESCEQASGNSWMSMALSSRDFYGHSFQDELWIIQSKIILDLAKEPCVIVGRCADYILNDNPNCLRVFIHADKEIRAKRIVEQYGESSASPQRRLRDKDKRRATYYQFYTDMKWGDVHNYDISLDSGRLGIDKCVDILAKL